MRFTVITVVYLIVLSSMNFVYADMPACPPFCQHREIQKTENGYIAKISMYADAKGQNFSYHVVGYGKDKTAAFNDAQQALKQLIESAKWGLSDDPEFWPNDYCFFKP